MRICGGCFQAHQHIPVDQVRSSARCDECGEIKVTCREVRFKEYALTSAASAAVVQGLSPMVSLDDVIRATNQALSVANQHFGLSGGEVNNGTSWLVLARDWFVDQQNIPQPSQPQPSLPLTMPPLLDLGPFKIWGSSSGEITIQFAKTFTAPQFVNETQTIRPDMWDDFVAAVDAFKK